MIAMNRRYIISISIALTLSANAARAEEGVEVENYWSLGAPQCTDQGDVVWVPDRGWSQKFGHFYVTFAASDTKNSYPDIPFKPRAGKGQIDLFLREEPLDTVY